MKLKLKHLAPYLPYKLKVIIYYGWPSQNIKTMMGISFNKILTIRINNYSSTSEARKFIPILHPLSDLTKQMKINGQKFVPIIELAKIADCHFKVIPEVDKVVSFEEDFCKIIQVWYKDKTYSSFELAYGIEEHSSFPDDNDGITLALLNDGYNLMCLNVYSIYQKLFEWHFDVFRLIERGLAIDVNNIVN